MSNDEEEPVVYAPIAFISEEGDVTAPMRQPRRRGRKPKQVEVRVRELRLTPADGQPVTDWLVGDPDSQISKLIACEEGGTGTDKALHYHAVIETTYTDDALYGWIKRVLRLTPFQNGNKYYRTGEFHENSIGYAVKNGQVKCSFGYTDEQVTKFIEDSKAYRDSVLAQRKHLQRLRSQNRQKQLKTIEEIVETRLKTEAELYRATHRTPPDWTAEKLVELILTESRNSNIEFPTRSQMSAMINRLRWTNGGTHHVIQFYARGMDAYQKESW